MVLCHGKGGGGWGWQEELVLEIPQNGRKQGSKNSSHHQREGEENKVKEGKGMQKRREKKTDTGRAQILSDCPTLVGWKIKPRKRAD